MKYGAIGGFVQFVFAKTAFDYIEKVLPQTDMPSYKKRVHTKRNRQPHATGGINLKKLGTTSAAEIDSLRSFCYNRTKVA
jgi:hypothetical protein